MRRAWAIALIMMGMVVGRALAAPSDVDSQVVANVTALQADHPFMLAVVLTPQPDWHIYWKNPGESGLPTAIHVKAPAGFTVGDVAFPVPRRIVVPGNIVNYGYEGPTTFLIPVTPPHELAAGNVDFQITVSWLCCQEECVPGRASLALSLPVGTSSDANAELFSKASALMPEQTPPGDAVVSAQKVNGKVGLHIVWKTRPAHVEVFPFAVDGLEISSIRVDTKEAESTVAVDAHVLSGQTLKAERLPVLVSFTDNGGRVRSFYTDMDLHALSAHASH